MLEQSSEQLSWKTLKVMYEHLLFIAWKVSKYGVISGPYSVRIQENTD